MKDYKHLEHLSDRYVLITLAYLWGVHIQEETVFVTRVVRSVALWTSLVIFCRIQLSLPCTCRYRSLHGKKRRRKKESDFNIRVFWVWLCLFCEMGKKIHVQGRTKLWNKGSKFSRNIGTSIPSYMVSHFRKYQSWYSPHRVPHVTKFHSDVYFCEFL